MLEYNIFLLPLGIYRNYLLICRFMPISYQISEEQYSDVNRISFRSSIEYLLSRWSPIAATLVIGQFPGDVIAR